MGIATSLVELREFAEELSKSLLDKVKEFPSVQAPSSLSDPQEQLEATIRLLDSSFSHKESGDYALAVVELAENLRYYAMAGESAKCGYSLLEISDCLFCAKLFDMSIDCCTKAISLLIKGKEKEDWAREMSAVGELLFSALVLYLRKPFEARESLMNLKASLTVKEKRVLYQEDAHKIAGRLAKSYKLKNFGPLEELRRMSPRKRRVETENLYALLEEWMKHFKAVRQAVNAVPKNEQGEKSRVSERAT
jgi:hypothetical protein